jgi:hypothetical protein
MPELSPYARKGLALADEPTAADLAEIGRVKAELAARHAGKAAVPAEDVEEARRREFAEFAAEERRRTREERSGPRIAIPSDPPRPPSVERCPKCRRPRGLPPVRLCPVCNPEVPAVKPIRHATTKGARRATASVCAAEEKPNGHPTPDPIAERVAGMIDRRVESGPPPARLDDELAAMEACVRALEGLDPGAARRALSWIGDRLGIVLVIGAKGDPR